MVAAIVGGRLLGRAGRPQHGARLFLRWACRNTTRGGGLEHVPSDARAEMLDNARAIVGELPGGTGEHLSRAALAAVGVPVTWLAGGESDPAFGAAARRASSVLPHCELREVPQSAHAMQFDRPDAIAEAVEKIARGVTEGGSAEDCERASHGRFAPRG